MRLRLGLLSCLAAAPAVAEPRTAPAAPAAAPAAGPSSGTDKTVGRITISPTLSAAPVDVWLTRTRKEDGGLIVKLVTRTSTTKALSLTIYTGGGDDDGAGDSDVRNLIVRPFDVPGGRRWVRIDFTYRIPDGGKRDERTDTTLVELLPKPRRLIDITTQQIRTRSKNCREGEETQLLPENIDGELRLVATTQKIVDPVLGEDDLPVDKKCVATAGVDRKVFRPSPKGFVSQQAAAAPAAAEEEGDD